MPHHQPSLDLKALQDSKLFHRLGPLAATVEAFAPSAAAYLGTINQHMPLFTLHNERHVLNVIGWMEWLLADCIGQLNPLECALCILSAYTHDLGMALSAAEHRAMLSPDGDTGHEFRAFLDGFAEEKHQIERLRRGGNRFAAQLIENHLLTEFLRRTHADRQSARLRSHLDSIVSHTGNHNLFTYQSVPFRNALETIAISHNRTVNWLRENRDQPTLTTGQEPANVYLIGLVLRLADILDFDSSRTPSILYRHLGLDSKAGPLHAGMTRHGW